VHGKDVEKFYVFEALKNSSLDHNAFNSARWIKNEAKRIRDHRDEVISQHRFLVSSLKDDRYSFSSILDFGGSLGTASYALDEAFKDRKFNYTVLETTEVCKEGKGIHSENSAVFVDSIDKIKNKIDVVYLRTSLQYAPSWKNTILSLCELSPSILIFDHLSAGKVTTTRLVQNYYGSKIPYWVISSDEMIDILSDAGYECSDIKKCQDFSREMFDPDIPEESRIDYTVRFTAVRKTDENK